MLSVAVVTKCDRHDIFVFRIVGREMMSNKRGRPRRQPYESLRTRMYMAKEAQYAGVEFRAAALRKHFEAQRGAAESDDLPKRVRRWEGWCRGTHSPSPQWRLWIESHFSPEQQQYLIAFYSLPMWDALRDEVSEEEWIKLARRLPADLSKRLLGDSPSGQQLRQGHPRLDCTISAAKRWGNLTAVTFLIILLRSGSVSNFSVDYFRLYRALSDTLAIAIVSGQYLAFIEELTNQIADTIKSPKPAHEALSPFYDEESTFKSRVKALAHYHSKRLVALKELDAISDDKDYSESCYLISKRSKKKSTHSVQNDNKSSPEKLLEEDVAALKECLRHPSIRLRKSFL